MKKFIKITAFILLCTIILGESLTLVRAEDFEVAEVAASEFVPPSEPDPFVDNVYVDKINQDAPFFDVILPQIAENIEEYNTHTINPTFDKLPELNNPENFQGLGHTTYANINGKTVTAEALFRVYNETSSDPNAGLGLLVYQCIQYKRAHPEEDVKITFSSYRTSCTASVCVIPESKYYGYMRSLYGCNYDEHGFVRISYMLTEAARMGIEVTLVNQLNSYAVKQYNPSTGKNASRKSLNFKTYFKEALKSDCYNSYEPGKKVSDFMNCVNVEWNITDITADMQHVKSATASHYLATDGTEHTSAVFVSSSNLDDNNYKGCNGNNNAQSGAIVSDHDELYRVTYNYMQLMAEYPGQEELYEFRKVVNELNEEQFNLIKSGREDEIPKDEQILYLGSETDKVFQMYFTPLGGSVDTWELDYNPICYHTEKFSLSDDYVELIWNEYGFGSGQVSDLMSVKIQQAFCDNPNINNKIALRVDNINTDEIQKLALGTEIGYRSINDGSKVHSKDILLNYSDNGVRHKVSLLTSCNFYPIAFNYRTNSILVIDETEESGGNFYEIMSEKYSYGMLNNDLLATPSNLVLEVGDTYTPEVLYAGENTLTWSTSKSSVATVNSEGLITAKKTGSATISVKDGTYTSKVKVTVVACEDCKGTNGFTGSLNEKFVLDNKLSTTPRSFEAVFSIKESELKDNATLFGSDGDYNAALVYYVNSAGNPCVMVREADHHYKKNTYTFDKVNVATGEQVHLNIVADTSAKTISCYIDGQLMQTLKNFKNKLPFEEKWNPVIGGEHKFGNAAYFTGEIYSIALWSDVRTADEITKGVTDGFDKADQNLLAAYDLTKCEDCRKYDLSANGIDIERHILWQDDVEPVGEYDYSFAVVGDTQSLAELDPLAMNNLYDWIVDNKDEHNIQYVLGLGDITENSTTDEWAYATESISKLNGVIPYSLVRGNHDTVEDFNKYLNNGYYETTVDGVMTEGDLTNSYRYFSIKGTDYLIMTVDFAPSEAVLQWANKVISEHPDHKVIITTHAYMYRDGTTVDAGDCYPPSYYKENKPELYSDAHNGDEIWEECISKHDNVLMVLSGHDPWQDIVYRQDETANCNVVTQMLINPQHMDEYIGATAMVAMFYFSNDGKTLTVRYYSVARDTYGSELSQFTVDLEPAHSYRESKVQATLTENGEIVTICDKCNQLTLVETIEHVEEVTLSQTGFVYTGSALKPSVTVKDTAGDTLEEGKAYTVTYDDSPKKPGKYSVKVQFTGDYTGETALYYTISPARVASVTSKQTPSEISLNWDSVLGADGYEVYLYNKDTDTFDLTANVTNTQYMLTGLEADTAYKIKIRAFVNAGEEKVFGEFSVVLEVSTTEKPAETFVYTDKDTDVSLTTSYKAELDAREITDEAILNFVDGLFVGESAQKVYSISLTDNGKEIAIEEFVKLLIPVEDEKSFIYRIDTEGNIDDMAVTFEDGYMMFLTDVLGMFVVTTEDEVIEDPSNPTKPSDPDNTDPSDPVKEGGILGDVNGDGKVNVKDATVIQKAAAKLLTLTKAELARADVNADTKVNVKDATAIQKYAAKIDTGYPIGEEII